MAARFYDVAIVGGGVSGTAFLYALSSYSNVGSMVLVEKNGGVAEENSDPMNNAQTSHDGGTETNYDLPHALQVREGALLLRRYVTSKNDPTLFQKTTRMVLGVGEREVRELEARFEAFREHYPDLRFVGPEELWALEPKVMEGRDPNQPVAALVSDEGYAINYQRLAEHFLADARMANSNLEMRFNTKVEDIRREGDLWRITVSPEGVFYAKVAVFTAGAYSLYYAHKLGYGRDFTILSVKGDFFSTDVLVNGKVYRPQVPGRPFAELHIDKDMLNPGVSRIGPTTRPMPLMESYHYETFWDFLRMGLVSVRGLWALFRILHKNKLWGYVAKNFVYSLPVLGQYCFLIAARETVPTLTYRGLERRRRAGGIRPQVVDLRTSELRMGDQTIVEEDIIFNTTPSPGASICLKNARRDAERVVKFLRFPFRFDREKFDEYLGAKSIA